MHRDNIIMLNNNGGVNKLEVKEERFRITVFYIYFSGHDIHVLVYDK